MDVQPTTMIAMATVNNLRDLLLDIGSVHEHQTLHNFVYT